MLDENGYAGHHAECSEAPLTCPNKCGADKIKRKDMESHRNQCLQEPVECPFAEAGCKFTLCRHQLEDHMTSQQQQHLLTLLTDYRKTKNKLCNLEKELSKTKEKLCEAKSKLAMAEDRITSLSKLQKAGDFVTVKMPNFSEYCHNGKAWQSPPFYYREGYKMCLAVYANGVGEGAGTHVSVSLFLLAGEYDSRLSWPLRCRDQDHGHTGLLPG